MKSQLQIELQPALEGLCSAPSGEASRASTTPCIDLPTSRFGLHASSETLLAAFDAGLTNFEFHRILRLLAADETYRWHSE